MQLSLILEPEQFPFKSFMRAVAYAQAHDYSFKAIIITGEKLYDRQAVLNNDPVNNELEPLAVKGNRFNAIIQHVKYMREQVIGAGLQFYSTVLVQPRIRDVLEEIKLSDVIFLEYNERRANPSSFDWTELFHLIPIHKQVIANSAHG